MTSIEKFMLAVLVVLVSVFVYQHITIVYFVRAWLVAAFFAICYGL